jgi:plasmid maintenance system antidote protein VapI
MLNPVHPGSFLRTEIIEAYGLSVTEAAKILRVSRPTLSSLLIGMIVVALEKLRLVALQLREELIAVDPFAAFQRLEAIGDRWS